MYFINVLICHIIYKLRLTECTDDKWRQCYKVNNNIEQYNIIIKKKMKI